MHLQMAYLEAPAAGSVAGACVIDHAARLTVEALGPEAAAAHVAEWQRLADDCLEPNAFFAPGFALAAARHLAKHAAPVFLFVWEETDKGPRRLVGLCPLAPRGGLARFLPQRLWTHAQAPLGTPLLDRSRARDALRVLLADCRRQAAGLLFPLLPQEGAVAQLLTEMAAAEGRPSQSFGVHQRAVLGGRQEAQAYLDRSITASRRRKLKRARALLEERGALALRVLRAPADIARATEDFLVLESRGWKGRRGTAFLCAAGTAAFARETAAGLAEAGDYVVASLDLDGKPLAMALILESGGRAFWWKIAYDEDFAAFSPGVLLCQEMTRALLAEPAIALTDSCASDEQPMIDHIWSERMAIGDLFVGLDAQRADCFATLARRESLYRAARGKLKAMVLRLRQMRRTPARPR